jgi:hypothetical protein
MDNDIEKASSDWLKKLSPEEPSGNFTRNVMQSIYALESRKERYFNYWWFLTLLPVFVGGIWYLTTIPAFTTRMMAWWEAVVNYYQALDSYFGDVLSKVKSISISPVIILGFLAILSLLVIEDIFSKSRNTKLNTE